MIRVILGTIADATRKIFRDTFNRANQTGIGTSSDGSLWQSIRGSFNITSNAADGQTPSNYPLAAVDMPKEQVTISLSGVTQGSTAALWITDSGNWYGIGIDQEPTECNCQTCENPATCNQFNTVCNAYAFTCNAWTAQCNAASYPCNAGNYFCDVVGNRFCSAWNARNCSAWSRPCVAMTGPSCSRWATNCVGWNTGNCAAYNSGNCNATNSTFTCTQYSSICNSVSYPCPNPILFCSQASYPCAAWNAATFYSCNCQTCYPQYIRFIQSASNVVTQLTSWTVGNIVQSFRVIISAINPQKTSATTTIKAYSDTNLSSQIGSDLTYTPTGVAINAKYGIMVKPSSYSQGSTIDEISIETT